MKRFPDRLRYAMTQAEISQAALAEKSGCSKAAISQYLSGKNTPGPEKMEALAAGALRALRGEEPVLTYTGVPVFQGFEKKYPRV